LFDWPSKRWSPVKDLMVATAPAFSVVMDGDRDSGSPLLRKVSWLKAGSCGLRKLGRRVVEIREM